MKNYLRGWMAVLSLLTFLLVGCGPAATPAPRPTPPPVPPVSMALPTAPPSTLTPSPMVAVPKATPKPAPSTVAPVACHVINNKADRRCTPGALNPMVTDGTVRQTICTAGYTATIRPPLSYTAPLKLRSMKAYGEPGPASLYEFDHLIPLELGGAPRDPANLFPQPYAGPQNAHVKDMQENDLHAAVCAGRLTLVGAQSAILTAWTHP